MPYVEGDLRIVQILLDLERKLINPVSDAITNLQQRCINGLHRRLLATHRESHALEIEKKVIELFCQKRYSTLALTSFLQKRLAYVRGKSARKNDLIEDLRMQLDQLQDDVQRLKPRLHTSGRILLIADVVMAVVNLCRLYWARSSC
jgi:hypothetical protein